MVGLTHLPPHSCHCPATSHPLVLVCSMATSPVHQALAQLSPHLLVLSSSVPSADALKTATDVLGSFFSHPLAGPVAEAILADPASGDSGRLYALKLVGYAVATRGGSGDRDLQGSLLRLLDAVAGGSRAERNATFVREKLAATIADLGSREFPQRWPGMVTDLVGTASSGPALAEIVASSLTTLATDCSSADFNGRLPAVRRGEVLQGLTATVSAFLPPFMSLLRSCLGAIAAPSPPPELPVAAATRLASRIAQLAGAMMFTPAAVQRDHDFLGALRACWDALPALQTRHRGAVSSVIVDGLVNAVVQAVDLLAARKYDSASDYDQQVACLGLLAHMGETCASLAWGVNSPAAVSLEQSVFRTLAGAIAAGGSHLIDPVASVAAISAGGAAVAEGAAATLQRFLALSVRLAGHPSLIVKTAIADALGHAIRSRALTNKLPQLANSLYEALPPLLLPALVKEGRFVKADLRTRLRRSGANPALSYVPKLPANYQASAEGLSPVQIEVLEGDFGDDEGEEYSLCYDAMRARATALLKGLAGCAPAHAVAAVCTVARDVLASACAPGVRFDAGTPYGASTVVSSAVRRADAALIAFEAVVTSIPASALSDPNGQVLSAMRACGTAMLGLIPSATDPIIRIRTTHVLSLLPRWYEAEPAVLQQVLGALFSSIEYQPPPALGAAAVAADAAPATAHAGSPDYFRQHLSSSAQYVRQRACQQLAHLARAIPRVLLPALQALSSEAVRLLSGSNLEPADEVSLYEVLVLISNALAADDPAGHASFVSQLLARPVAAWASDKVTAAVASPSSLLQYLFGASTPTSAGASDPPMCAAEESLKRAEGLVHKLHLLWCVARRGSAAELAAASGAAATQSDQPKRVVPGLPPMASPSVRVHPFASAWTQIIPNVLALLRSLHGLWEPEARGVLFAPPASPSSPLTAPLSVLPRYLLACSREEVFIFGRTGKGDPTATGDDSDDEDGSAVPSSDTIPLLTVDSRGVPSTKDVQVPAGFVQLAERCAAFYMRCLWHGYALVGFCATGHIQSGIALHVTDAGMEPAMVAQVTSAGLYSPQVLGLAWPQLSALCGEGSRHVPSRVHRMMLQQLLPELLTGCPAAPEALGQVLPLLAGTLSNAHAQAAAEDIGRTAAYHPKVGALLPDHCAGAAAGPAGDGATPSTAGALIDGVAEKIRRDVQRSLVDVASAMLPAPLARPSAAPGSGRSSPPPPGGPPLPPPPAMLLPTARTALCTPAVATPLAAALAAAVSWPDTHAAQKACQFWHDRALPALPLLAGQPGVVAHWAAGASAAFEAAVRALVLGSPHVAPCEWEVIALATDAYCRIALGFPAGSGAMAADLSAAQPLDGRPRAFLVGLAGLGSDGTAALEAALRRQGGEKERRHAMRDALQAVAATALPPSAAADLGMLAASGTAVRPASGGSAVAVRELPEKLVMLGRKNGGRGSSTEADSAPLEGDTGLTALFGGE